MHAETILYVSMYYEKTLSSMDILEHRAVKAVVVKAGKSQMEIKNNLPRILLDQNMTSLKVYEWLILLLMNEPLTIHSLHRWISIYMFI